MAFGAHHCTQHRVLESQLIEKVLSTIKAYAQATCLTPAEIREKLEQARTDQTNHEIDSLNAMIAKDEDRMLILTRMMSQLYEDRISGIITEDNFNTLR